MKPLVSLIEANSIERNFELEAVIGLTIELLTECMKKSELGFEDSDIVN